MVLRFHDCVLDPERRVLTVSGQLVDMQPLIFDLLVFLADNPNRVVSKDEMLRAAWRSTVVSDSVVARAVMKLRRAIGDDAAQARVLLTVHRIGYRFVADVRHGEAEPVLPQADLPPIEPQARPAPAHGLALSAFENLSGDTTLDALLPELHHVVRHLVGDHAGLASVGAEDVLRVWQDVASEADPLAAACARLNCRELAVATVTASGGQTTVRLVRGATTAGSEVRQFAGPDLLRLASRVAEALTGEPGPIGPMRAGEEPFWQAQYSRAIKLHRQGRPEPALELLQLCRPHLSPTPSMCLMQGRLHLALGELAPARTEFDDAHRQATAGDLPAVQFEVQLAMAELAIAAQQPQEAMQACLQALQVLRQHPSLAPEGPQLMLRFADALAAGGRATEAVQLAERAVVAAQRLGHRSVEMACRLGLGQTLWRFRQLHRASDALERIVDIAEPLDDSVRLEALLLLAEIHGAQHRHRDSVELARQARTLARRVRPSRVGQAVALELDGLLGSDQTEAVALQLRQRWGFEGGLDPAAPAGIVHAHAVVLWRQGSEVEAIEALQRAVEALAASAPAALRTALAGELCFMLASRGDPDGMARWSDWLNDADDSLRARLDAAAALARGRRDDALQRLAEAWDGLASHPWDGFDTGVDLAWMLLEDARLDELDRVIAQVLEMPVDHGPLRLLQAAYALPAGGGPAAERAWQQALAPFAGLRRRQPAVAQGPRRNRLTELLTRACR